MKIEKEFAPITIKIETREEWEQFLEIVRTATKIRYDEFSDVRDHANQLLKLLKEA